MVPSVIDSASSGTLISFTVISSFSRFNRFFYNVLLVDFLDVWLSYCIRRKNRSASVFNIHFLWNNITLIFLNLLTYVLSIKFLYFTFTFLYIHYYHY